ncbi:MAG: hypothetical protein ACJ741_04620 [Pyrinomonadaceae bacterium]
MESWLATHALEVLFTLIVATSGGVAGWNKRRDRQLKECRAKCKQLTADLKRARRDYGQSLEFNLQDRWTIRELAKMVSDYRRQLKLPDGDILLDLYRKAEAEIRVRRLPAGIHVTSSHPSEEETFTDE